MSNREFLRILFLDILGSIFISAFFIDYIVHFLPEYNGNRLLSVIFAGVFAGIGYAIFYNYGSSTGGTDFIIMAIKNNEVNISFGFLTFIIDSIVIFISVFVFKEMDVFILGIIYTIITSMFLDITTKILKFFEKEDIIIN